MARKAALHNFNLGSPVVVFLGSGRQELSADTETFYGPCDKTCVYIGKLATALPVGGICHKEL